MDVAGEEDVLSVAPKKEIDGLHGTSGHTIEPAEHNPWSAEIEALDVSPSVKEAIAGLLSISQQSCVESTHRSEDEFVSPRLRHGLHSSDVSSSTNSLQQFGVQEGFPVPRPDKRTGVHKCQACNKIYPNRRNLCRHMKYECGIEPQSRCSYYCAVHRKYGCQIKFHLKRNHITKVSGNERTSPP